MPDVCLYLWDFCVAFSIFGSGRVVLRLLGFRDRTPWVVSGVFGVSLWIAVGGVLNLLHLLRLVVFFSMTAIGVVLFLFELALRLRSKSFRETGSARSFPLHAKILLSAATVMIGVMMAGGMRPLVWNVDDLQGYIPLGMKALQAHSVQPDPFCERRIQAGVGGANFLDTMMFAEGDVRAMPFIDSTFGLFVYALGLWAVARRWKVSPTATALALFCLPFATLIKVNLTIVYLSAAGMYAALLLMSDLATDKMLRPGRVAALGIIVGALCTTKSPNIVFIVIFLAVMVLLLKLFDPGTTLLVPVCVSVLIAVAVVVPWSASNKINSGTYLYPLLGKGVHVTAYHLIPSPSELGSMRQLALLLAPSVLALALVLVVGWNLSREWSRPTRAGLLAYLIAALLGVPIIIYGLGGDGGDRYTAPFLMPALLLGILVVCDTHHVTERAWQFCGVAAFVLIGFYVTQFLGERLMWYRDITMLAYEAVGLQPPILNPYLFRVDRSGFEKDRSLGASIQATMAPGATAIEDMEHGYVFDFSRNRILIQDHAGMASPAPGMPLTGSPQAMQDFLVSQGIEYIIFDKKLYCGRADLTEFLQNERLNLGWRYLLHNPEIPHIFFPWAHAEESVSCDVRSQMKDIIDQSPQVYNDGRIIVAHIR